MLSYASKLDPTAENSLSAAVLAGGKARRMEGRKKALLTVGGESILSRTLGVLSEVADPVVLIANEPLAFSRFDLAVYSDVIPGCGALGGLYSALFFSRTPWVLVTACDMPFLSRAMAGLLASSRTPGADAVVPKTQKGFEPLCALYSRSCLAPVKNCLGAGRLKVTSFFPRVRLSVIHEDALRAADPDLASFLNVNTPEDLAAAEETLLKAVKPAART